MRDLPYLAARLFNAPLMLDVDKLDAVVMALGPRLMGADTALLASAGAGQRVEVAARGAVGVVPVLGSLVNRSGFLQAASGLSSYAEIAQAAASAFSDPSIEGVVMEIDSPGGEVGGVFDLTDRLLALKAETGKPFFAVASESALSAGYAIAAAADRIYVTQTGLVGSVGVVAAHLDQSARDAEQGLKWTYVAAGERKLDGNPHGPLSKAALGDLQADVDAIYARFVDHVAAARGLKAAAVKATEAKVFRGAGAVDARLADRVGTLETALRDLASTTREPGVRRVKPRTLTQPQSVGANVARKKDEAQDAPAPADQYIVDETMDEEAKPLQQPTPTLPVEKGPEIIEEAEKDAAKPASPTRPAVPGVPGGADWHEAQARQEAANLMLIADQARRLGLKVDPHKAFAQGVKPDDLRAAVLGRLAARCEAETVVAARAADDTPQDGTANAAAGRLSAAVHTVYGKGAH